MGKVCRTIKDLKTSVLADDASCAVLNDRSERKTSHRLCIGKVWHPCASVCDESTRLNARNASDSWRNGTCMVSHLEGKRHSSMNKSSNTYVLYYIIIVYYLTPN